MVHTPHFHDPAHDPACGLVWNADLTLQSDTNPTALQRRAAIDRARQARPRTAHIEREIMLAVVLLYVLILGSFAGLHWYGHISLPTGTAVETVPAQSGE